MSDSPVIRFIGEGVTDYQVIHNILGGIFGLDVNFGSIQPPIDATDTQAGAGNWTKVFDTCASNDFKESFQLVDWVIIQIDTDVCHEKQFEIPNCTQLGVADKIQAVKQRLIKLIGESFYEEYKDRIIFAICVDEIECWILPLYFPNDKAKASKTVNCLNTLNTELQKKFEFTIDSGNKNYRKRYIEITKDFRKEKNIIEAVKKNESFNDFYQQIKSRVKLNE